MFLLGRLHRSNHNHPPDNLFSGSFLSILAASIIHEGSANVSNASKICWTVRPVARGVLRDASSRSLISGRIPDRRQCIGEADRLR
jgi:hypothetical protein